VSSTTCNELAKQPDIDGFFVGGAAWNAVEFSAIANSVKVKKVCACNPHYTFYITILGINVWCQGQESNGVQLYCGFNDFFKD